ncbi:MAG: helix-turn-helix domain-containing protein [Chryseobacterium sp.]|jgi:hypothetical protein|uniref:helix-turn-helix domain-containing protein n=1 Tax=Chryseobacterium sp. TaxID=1871047 RepID=UPI00283371B4|nr:helix-turn-helix domain-containing protein [Chryseobacterium sp.]MDR2238335.1 helix-turn-helix domain-containing protein [Chryseobacterium sp.]
MKTNEPKYKIIYTDILTKKCPEKMEICHDLLEKSDFSFMDILELNELIFGDNPENRNMNARFRCYSKSDILGILEYQKKNKLNNSAAARHFNLSRTTLLSWKKKLIK